MRVKRSVYNLIFGFVSQIITIALGIAIPRLFLISFGSEVNGLMSSINQIFVYITLLEAGVGAASIQALYNPISKGDRDSINSILSATSMYYKKTGIYYFFAVLTFALIYPFTISSNLDKITIMNIILLTGIGGVFNYFFQGKYKLLLIAEGKNYINTIISTIINFLNSFVKIILLVLGFNIIVVQTSYLIMMILQMIIFKIYIDKNYKWVNLRTNPNFRAISQKKSVLIHQISSLVFNNTDVLILTIFCGLKVVSVYVMYNMFFSMIDNVISNVNNSITFVLGQSYHENKEKFIKIYDSYETYFMAFVFAIFCIVYILILPFMKLYTAEIKDINYIDFWLPVFFISLKLLSCARIPSGNIINIAGHFKNTQNRSILESIINIVCSLLFVIYYGIYGVLIGTIIALLYRSIDMIIYANRKILNRNPWITIKRWLIDLGLLLIIILFNNIIKINLVSYIEIILGGILLTIVIFPIYFIVISVMEREVCGFTIAYFKKYIFKILKRK